MKVKGWAKFQHFKDRRPPWIKLYRELLEELKWHELEPKAAKLLISLWLLASEDELKEGNLPDTDTICFRLRITKKELQSSVCHLSHWLIQDDISVISDADLISNGYHASSAETETETETETDICSFDVFWKAYPRKVAKDKAQSAWKKIPKSDHSRLMVALEQFKKSPDWNKERGAFIPYPASWLNGRRWNDEIAAPKREVLV